MFGPWKKIAEGYGKMVLGYFGKTPVAPNSDVVKLASEQLKLNPTTQKALDLADADDTKSLVHVKETLKKEKIEITDENLFIAASCKEKGIAFLKGEAKVNVRKIEPTQDKTPSEASEFTVRVNGETFYVQTDVASGTLLVNGETYQIDLQEGFEEKATSSTTAPSLEASGNGSEIRANIPGSIFKVLANVGDSVLKGQVVIVIEAMKMEIEVVAPKAGVISAMKVKQGDTVVNNQVLAVL